MPRKRSVRADSRYQVSWAAASSGAFAASRLSSADSRADVRPARPRRRRAAPGGGLVGDVRVERVAQLHEVVGEQPEPGVAQVGLHAGRAAGHLGLAAQRLELAAQLGGEVGEPVEVGLHRVELAERLLLALAVLEDAGGLLDEGAPVLGRPGEDGVELALADDDVHLAADAGVAEQLLDVEQPDLVAVDLVLALPGAVHAAGDRHLGVVDRQRAVGVVDGERHLGPAERRAAGGAGEDDVLHLAAAQALGALLAEDPGDGVDDVGLARAVGADDGGDPRLERRVVADAKDLKPLSVRLDKNRTPSSSPLAGSRRASGRGRWTQVRPARARRCRRPGSAARGRWPRRAEHAAPPVPAPVGAPEPAGRRSPLLLGALRGATT
jgi:hypothetical protein